MWIIQDGRVLEINECSRIGKRIFYDHKITRNYQVSIPKTVRDAWPSGRRLREVEERDGEIVMIPKKLSTRTKPGSGHLSGRRASGRPMKTCAPAGLPGHSRASRR
jgi:hypothetical protein